MTPRTRRVLTTGRPHRQAAWFLTVERQHRLRIPDAAKLVIPWLSSSPGSMKCVAFVGPVGGVVLANEKRLEALSKLVQGHVKSRQVRVADAGTSWVALGRYLATSWTVTIGVESNRFTLTLPEEARKLGLAPSAGQVAVVFALDGLLEVWPANAWLAHVRSSAESIDELRQAVINSLEEHSETL